MVYLSGAGLPRLSFEKRPLNGCSVIVVVVIVLRCRKRRKQQITTQAIRRGARKPWLPVAKTSNNVDSSVVLLD